eukprot:3614180-Rhodomonas_salina.1
MQLRGTCSATNQQYVFMQIEGQLSRDRKIAHAGSALKLELLRLRGSCLEIRQSQHSACSTLKCPPAAQAGRGFTSSWQLPGTAAKTMKE